MPVLRDRETELQSLREELNRFTYTIAHDLGAPLRAVVCFSQLFTEKYAATLDEKALQYLGFIHTGGQKAQAMLDGLLRYSRLQTGVQSAGYIDTALIIGKCHAALHQKIAQCGGCIEVMANVLPVVTGDSEKLLEVFLAVIDNALTYRRPGVSPHVRIMLEESEKMWKFLIEDDGIGIAPAGAKRIFELFKRLHTDAEYPGVGMGLAIARRIVEAHGGTIGVLPADGGGTICWFTLPKPELDRASPAVFQESAHG